MGVLALFYVKNLSNFWVGSAFKFKVKGDSYLDGTEGREWTLGEITVETNKAVNRNAMNRKSLLSGPDHLSSQCLECAG